MKNNGFVLGGGAARGLAHIGIMKAFYEKGILPDAIAGTSMGAIVGSLLAVGMHPEEIETEVKKTKIYKLIDFKVSKAGLLPGDKVFEKLKKYLGAVTFESTKVPLRICAVDIEKGTLETFQKGQILPAVRASMSIPGVFLPVKYKNRFYVDGGLINNLPIDALDDLKCKNMYAVSVRRSVEQTVLYRKYLDSDEPLKREFQFPRHKLIYDVLKKSYHIVMNEQEKRMLERYPKAHIITPKMNQFDYADFMKKDEIVDVSYKEGKRIVKGVGRRE